MDFITLRYNIIKNFIAKEMLEENIFPTLEAVCAIAMQRYSGYNAYDSIIGDDIKVELNETASAAKFNYMQKTFEIEISTLYSFLEYIEEYLNASYSSAMNKMTSLSSMIDGIKKKAEELLFINSNNFFAVENILEDFNTPENLDLIATDAYVDYDDGHARAKSTNEIKFYNTLSSLKTIASAPITISFIMSKLYPDLPLSNVLKDSASVWMHDIIMPFNYRDSVVMGVKIELIEAKKISSIRIKMGKEVIGSEYAVSMQAKIAGNIVNVSDEINITDTGFIDFDEILTDTIYLKIKTNSSRISDKGLLFRFSIDKIDFSDSTYASKSILQSKEINVPQFSKVNLSFDQVAPKDTSVDYYVLWRKDDGNWTEEAVNGDDQIINVVSNSSYTLLDNDSHAVTSSLVHPYLFGNNYAVNKSFANLPSVIYQEPIIIRNAGGFLVNSSNNTVSCQLFVTESTEVDFSIVPGYLNGTYQNTKIILEPDTIYTFLFSNNSSIEAYGNYFASVATLRSGSVAAEYVDPDVFVNTIEDDAEEYYSFINIGGNFYPILKGLGLDHFPSNGEEVYYLYKNIDSSALPNKIKYKAIINAKNKLTPRIYNIKIKVG